MSLGEDKTVGRVSDSVTRQAVAGLEANFGLRFANPTNEAELYRLDSLIEITSSKRIHMADYVQNGIPFYRGKEVIERAKGNAISTELFITADKFQEIKNKFGSPEDGDILLTSVGTLGVPYFISRDGDFYFKDGNVTWFRKFAPNINSKFLYYWLTSPATQQRLDDISIGSTQKALTITALKTLEILLPNLMEQQEVVEILDSVSHRIALLRETNATLEAIAQALCKSWFVDFDPVHAKQQGQEPEGMDADTAALFPDGFKDSELGVVPRGWRVSTIDQVTSLIIDYRGKTPKKLGRDWANSGIQAVSAKNIKRGRLVEKQAMNFVDNDLFDIWMKDKLESGDILMTSEAPLGELLYLADEHNFCLSQRVFALRANSTNCLSSFLYFWLSSKNVQEHLAARATGTTVVGIRQSELRKIEVLLPPLPIQEKANDILRTCLLRIEKNEAEKESLTTLRDTLLPRLISGQFRLPDAEEAVV